MTEQDPIVTEPHVDVRGEAPADDPTPHGAERANDIDAAAEGGIAPGAGESTAGDPGAAAPALDVEVPSDVDDTARALEQARAEAAGHLDDLQRLKAEFENFRKRMLKEQSALTERATAALVERLLPVLDAFQLALMAADRTKDYESMVRGVELVYGDLIEVLRREGLERIEAAGKPFDPEHHEAVMQSDGEGDQVVVAEEMRAGYTLRGRVLRPAMVKVTHA